MAGIFGFRNLNRNSGAAQLTTLPYSQTDTLCRHHSFIQQFVRSIDRSLSIRFRRSLFVPIPIRKFAFLTHTQISTILGSTRHTHIAMHSYSPASPLPTLWLPFPAAVHSSDPSTLSIRYVTIWCRRFDAGRFDAIFLNWIFFQAKLFKQNFY